MFEDYRKFEDILDDFIRDDGVITTLEIDGQTIAKVSPVSDMDGKRFRESLKAAIRALHFDLKNSREESTQQYLDGLHGAN